jgi:hypothetical protein
MSNLKGVEHFLKIYHLNPDKLGEFRKFFNEGQRGPDKKFKRDEHGNPIEGVRKWLIDKGVNTLLVWLITYPHVNAKSGGKAQPEDVVLCAVSLKNTDWYEIPALKEYLREGYDPPQIELQPDFCFSVKIGIIKAVIEKLLKLWHNTKTRLGNLKLKVLTSLLNR